jgi:hypothetical protein
MHKYGGELWPRGTFIFVLGSITSISLRILLKYSHPSGVTRYQLLGGVLLMYSTTIYGELEPFETSPEDITEIICHPFHDNWYFRGKRFLLSLLRLFVHPRSKHGRIF